MVTVGDRFLLSASPITPLLSHYITDTAPACVVPSLRIHTALHPRLPTINTFNDFPQFPPSAWPASASFQPLLCIPWQQAFMRSAPPKFIDSTRNRHELPAEHDVVCTHPRAAKRPFYMVTFYNDDDDNDDGDNVPRPKRRRRSSSLANDDDERRRRRPLNFLFSSTKSHSIIQRSPGPRSDIAAHLAMTFNDRDDSVRRLRLQRAK